MIRINAWDGSLASQIAKTGRSFPGLSGIPPLKIGYLLLLVLTSMLKLGFFSSMPNPRILKSPAYRMYKKKERPLLLSLPTFMKLKPRLAEIHEQQMEL